MFIDFHSGDSVPSSCFSLFLSFFLSFNLSWLLSLFISLFHYVSLSISLVLFSSPFSSLSFYLSVSLSFLPYIYLSLPLTPSLSLSLSLSLPLSPSLSPYISLYLSLSPLSPLSPLSVTLPLCLYVYLSMLLLRSNDVKRCHYKKTDLSVSVAPPHNKSSIVWAGNNIIWRLLESSNGVIGRANHFETLGLTLCWSTKYVVSYINHKWACWSCIVYMSCFKITFQLWYCNIYCNLHYVCAVLQTQNILHTDLFAYIHLHNYTGSWLRVQLTSCRDSHLSTLFYVLQE